MKFVKFKTLTFVPTRSTYQTNPTKTVDVRDNNPISRVTYISADKIMSVYKTTHPEIKICDCYKRPIHTVLADTTALQMVDGTIYYVESAIDTVMQHLVWGDGVEYKKI